MERKSTDSYCDICKQYRSTWVKSQQDFLEDYFSGIKSSINILQNMARESKAIPSFNRQWVLYVICICKERPICGMPISFYDTDSIAALKRSFESIESEFMEMEEKAKKKLGDWAIKDFLMPALSQCLKEKRGNYIAAFELFHKYHGRKWFLAEPLDDPL